jgi:hypothetical protein
MKANQLQTAKNYSLRMSALGIFVLLLALSGHAAGLLADDQPSNVKGAAATFEQRVQSDTELLMATATRSAKIAGTDERLAWEKTLLEIAERRQAAMISLMENAPDMALKLAFPAERRDRLAAAVRGHVEELVSLEGTLEVLGWVDDDGRVGYERYLDLGDTRLQLFVEDLPDNYINGTRVRVDGLRLADRLAANKTGMTALAHDDPAQGNEPDGTTGVTSESALVINVKFPTTATEPWTIAQATNVFANQAVAYFAEVSYHHYSFQADVAGWYTIAPTTGSCQANILRDRAVAAATADGWPVSQYNHVVIAFPRVAACSWAGLGQQPGRYTWLNNAMRLSVGVHELGHNLNLAHSHSRNCTGDGPLSDPCTTAEYGDRFDVMGSGGAVSYHGAYKAFKGWIPASDVIQVTPADVAATVQLYSVENDEGLPRVLRVDRPGTSPQPYFYIEMREAVGVDAPLRSYPRLQNGVAVYLGRPNNQSIINMGQRGMAGETPLLVGNTLYDPTSDLNITLLSMEDGVATVYVSYVP